ncbi:MAG: ftsW [Bacillales bacterium]|jgi:cell division protein FtsW|nr:ftsW [Bacillales bacterium]
MVSHKSQLKLKSLDYALISLALTLAGMGIVMVYSASMVSSIDRHEVASNYFFIRQCVYLVVGVISMFFFTNFNYETFGFEKLSWYIYGLSTFLLVAVLLFGDVINNARSWFDLGVFSIQPAEFSKIFLILFLSSEYTRRQNRIENFKWGYLPPLVYIGLNLFLILLQPDLGAIFIITVTTFGIFITSGMSWRKLSIIILSLALVVTLLGTIVMQSPERFMSQTKINRFTGFLKPFETEKDAGYHTVGSLLAIGSGGITGLGIGQSMQKYGYLPEPQTDFIVSVIAEELGFVGVMVFMIILLAIIIKGFRIAGRCQDPLGRMIATGISTMIAVQALVNLGGATALIPITGVTLPFVSFGGSSMILSFMSIGILSNISMSIERKKHMEMK